MADQLLHHAPTEETVITTAQMVILLVLVLVEMVVNYMSAMSVVCSHTCNPLLTPLAAIHRSMARSQGSIPTGWLVEMCDTRLWALY